jgi:hypothetical protein
MMSIDRKGAGGTKGPSLQVDGEWMRRCNSSNRILEVSFELLLLEMHVRTMR